MENWLQKRREPIISAINANKIEINTFKIEVKNIIYGSIDYLLYIKYFSFPNEALK